MPAFPWLPTWLPLQVSLVGSSGSPSPAKVQSPWCGRWIRIWMPGFHHSVGSSPWTWHFGSAYLTYLDHKEITYWTIKKAEPQRTGAFELWCWRRLLRVTWTARRSNQSILKEINPEYSLEVIMLKLKLQYFGHLMWRTDSLEKTLMLGKIKGRRKRGNRGWDGWIASLTQWTWV